MCDDVNYVARMTLWFVYAIMPWESFIMMVNCANVFGRANVRYA